MFRKFHALALMLILASAHAVRSGARTYFNPVQYVDPFVGTGNSPLPDYLGGNSSGNTFPGATMPFGMIQWSPDTEKGFGKDERGSYLYADTRIRGFSLTHLSGPGCPVFGDVPILPVVGQVEKSPAADPDAYLSKFS